MDRPPPPRPEDASMLSVLRVPAYRRALVGRALSGVGGWMQTVAAGFLVYDLTHRAAAVGLLTLLARGPSIGLAAMGGAAAERVGVRRLLLLLTVAQVVAAAVLAAFTLAGSEHVALVYACTLVIGLGSALGNAGMQGLLVDVVGPEMHKSATAVGAMTYNVGRLAGPALAGVFLGLGAPGWCFAVNAISFAALLVALAGIPVTATATAAAPLRGVARTLVRAPGISEILLLLVAFMALVTPLQELAPVIARDRSDDPHLLGLLVTVMAAGGLVGAWVRQRLDRRHPGTEMLLTWVVALSGLALAAIGVTDGVVFPLAAMFCAGVLTEVLFVESLSTMQERVSAHATLVSGVFFAVQAAAITGGTLAVGVLVDEVGLSAALLASGATLLLVGLLSRIAVARAET